ncbi:phage holin family protein [Fulvivirga lutea]|uniref:Phage holin family protein n=1 Tax=Fulvivirga lutea TaxID=2810512 RepID=A0A975A0E6_9BACT|nr:phage holin family protein [Fulvivirga lutea]QSE96731.1 phage holin family protein [Fulvivirga lutea]
MNFLVKLLISGLAVILTSYLLPGVSVDGYFAAVLVAAILSLLNVIVRPILIVLTIPITVFTLGLFLLVINALMILIADYFIPDFYVDNFWWALLFSVILAVINSIFADFSKK